MFHLSIVSAEQTVYEGDVEKVIAPSVDGEVGILKNHHPMVTKLGPGALRVTKTDGNTENMFVAGGYLEVSDNKVIVLASIVEDIDAIQLEQAIEARKKAQEMLKTTSDEVEREKLEKELQMHMIRVRMAEVSKFKKQ